MKTARELAMAIGRVGQMECSISDCLVCKDHIESAVSIILADRERVRRETVEKIKKAWDEACKKYETVGDYAEDARYNYPDREEYFENSLAGMLAEREGGQK